MQSKFSRIYLFYILSLFVIAMMFVSSCASRDQNQTKTAVPAKFDTPEFESITKTMDDLRELLIDLTAYQACERIKGRFSTLSAQGASPEGSSDPAVGVFWIQDCTAKQIDAQHLSITLSGKGWRWISREKENAGAKFIIDENVRFNVQISMVGTLDMEYSKQNHVVTSWMIPTQPVEANFQVSQDIDVDAEGIWGSIVGGAASLIGKSPEARAKKTINKKGSSKIESKLSHGLTLVLDLCTGQRYTKFGKLAAGELPDTATPAEGKNFQVNNRAQLHAKGLVLSGPFETTQPVIAKLSLAKVGGGVHAALVCKQQAEVLANQYLAGETLGEIDTLTEQQVTKTAPVTLEAEPSVNCPVMLVMRPMNDHKDPVTLNYRVFHEGDTQKPLVSCK